MSKWEFGEGGVLVYLHSCSVSTSDIDKVKSINKGTAVNESEVIQINNGDIEDGFQVLFRSS